MARPDNRLPPPRAMITAPQPEAVEAGMGVLAEGGNAIDAVLACAFTQGVTDPLMCGIAGLGVLQVFDPARGDHLVLDGLSTCPAACTETMWQDVFEGECPDGYGYILKGHINELGHGAATTPGILRLLAQAHQRWGSRPWASLLQPAIAAASEGCLIRPHVASMFALDETAYGRVSYRAKLAYTEDGRRLYLRPDGSPKRLGDVVRNPELAATLGIIARDGAEALHTGVLARQIVADMERHGGWLSAADLAGFSPQMGPPLAIDYHGRHIAVPPPPAGGIMVAEMLRILEGFDLAALGHNSIDYICVFAEAMKYAGRDKDRHIGDPRFVTPPLERLLSDAYAAECADAIRAGIRVHLPRGDADGEHTTTVSCVDANGMVVSLTHTLGLPSGVIVPGTGFMLNGAMNWYDPRPGRAGSIGPGKRRFSSMSPTIVLEGGKPVATLGAPGGAWIPIAIAQALVNLLDFGMTMQEAVQAPRFSATSDAIDIGNRIPRATQRGLEARGYEVKRLASTFPFAGVHGISMWDGRLQGGADPQRDGLAAGLI